MRDQFRVFVLIPAHGSTCLLWTVRLALEAAAQPRFLEGSCGPKSTTTTTLRLSTTRTHERSSPPTSACACRGDSIGKFFPQWRPPSLLPSRVLRILHPHQMDRLAQIPCLQTSRRATHPFEGSSMICTWIQKYTNNSEGNERRAHVKFVKFIHCPEAQCCVTFI